MKTIKSLYFDGFMISRFDHFLCTMLSVADFIGEIVLSLFSSGFRDVVVLGILSEELLS